MARRTKSTKQNVADFTRPQPVTKPMGKEVGATGLIQYSGFIYEEQVQELQGYRWAIVVRQMLNHPIIAAILDLTEYLLRQADWPVVPLDKDNAEDKKAAAFVEQCLHEMQFTWQDTLAEIVTMMAWGWSILEIKYGQREDGMIGWAKWATRAQETLYKWEFDDIGNATHMIQLPPPDFRLREIPLEKCLHFTTSKHKNNPEGKSLLRKAYIDWYYATNLNRIEAIGLERKLSGIPLIRIPATVIQENGATYNAYKNIGINLRKDEQACIILPSERESHGELLYNIELIGPSGGGSQDADTQQAINRHEIRISQALLADFIMLGHDKVGSFALADSKTDMFAVALGAFMDGICQTINKKAIPGLLKLNPELKGQCELTHSDLEHVDLNDISVMLKQFAVNGISLTPDEQQWIKKQVGFPQTSRSLQDDGDDEEIAKAETVLLGKPMPASITINPGLQQPQTPFGTKPPAGQPASAKPSAPAKKPVPAKKVASEKKTYITRGNLRKAEAFWYKTVPAQSQMFWGESDD